MNSELRKFRINQNKSVREMSEYLGVSKSSYEKVEYEQRTPSYRFVCKFKQKFPECNADKFFFPS